MIRFENVKKQYDDGFIALKNINLEIKKGELVTLIGPSGCGKTTTMRMVNRLTEPTSGKIYIDGQDISTIDPVELRRNIGYVIQQIGLFPHMTIAQNITLVPKLKKWKADMYEKRVDELLDLVGLDPSTFKHRYPSELSGGQQQRVGVIRALAAEPDIILMDEPFSALDPISREQLQDDIVKLQEEVQKTIVFVTHDMDEALKIANRIAIMKEGEIVQFDTPDKILRRPANEFVRGFIGENRLQQGNSLVPTAKDLMSSFVVTASPNRGLAEAFRLMKEKKVDSLMITDKKQVFLGIVTLKELEKQYDKEEWVLADITDENCATLTKDDDVTNVAEIFQNKDINVIPILEGDRLAGVITRSSLMRGLAEWEFHKQQ
ncbi:betaine/proline/choline family ABC transporter ATP-binding protein [Anoxybacillus rupiensis]|uniref:Quaternary amine transport ATP-binding protein n=1 Tax=Anoxybacteroides rupiense TaxID=311460 RepID=A0ABT5W3R4_9BACL|nr:MULTISPECIES: betaine/proline/choline family ABC transporter ATP-binding protein [Anoxybacillus]MBS2772156.1 betaine/proline/choline family ABC transporter ATP-binding protein [Anoxybacillus rupiensis]MDE8563454.1 betaine/proline/choline family ABC transporter ATP-binding protein [Anoxybacillus rupiensis]QHC02900.1 betaine/proline/choline family ABC transporter ATP-binding protein [Anoxybacillus sp. PDR2]